MSGAVSSPEPLFVGFVSHDCYGRFFQACLERASPVAEHAVYKVEILSAFARIPEYPQMRGDDELVIIALDLKIEGSETIEVCVDIPIGPDGAFDSAKNKGFSDCITSSRTDTHVYRHFGRHLEDILWQGAASYLVKLAEAEWRQCRILHTAIVACDAYGRIYPLSEDPLLDVDQLLNDGESKQTVNVYSATVRTDYDSDQVSIDVEYSVDGCRNSGGIILWVDPDDGSCDGSPVELIDFYDHFTESYTPADYKFLWDALAPYFFKLAQDSWDPDLS